MTAFDQLTAPVAPADARERARIHEAIGRLALPRMTGSAGAAEVEAYLKGELEHLGWEVRELPFSFSALPGRFGVSVAGLIFLIGGVTSAALAGAHHGGAALAVLSAVVVLLALAGYLARTAVARLPWGRLRTANWLVTRPGARPRYLVCAHRDSKSQPIPLLVRAGGIGLAPIAALALLLLCIVSFLGPESWHLGLAAGLIALLCAASGLVLILSFVQNDSPGALDNASGLTTLLGLAERERENGDVGFLVTDGEELGLAGACAACHQLPPVHGIINVDGVDDGGDFHIVERHGLRRRGLAPQLVAALLMAADGLGVRAQRRAVPVGVMVDHIPLAQAGISAVTLMRGGRDSLLRVHRPQDDTSRLSGEGIALAVALISAALAVLRRPAGAA